MEPVRWFKLLMLQDKDLVKEEIGQSKQLQEARSQLRNRPDQLTAIQLVGRYLRSLWDHAYAMLKTMVAIDDFPLRVAITIPAIWPHYAQSAMREAAEVAGITAERPMGAPTLDLVQEPEAASLSIMQERELLPKIKVNATSLRAKRLVQSDILLRPMSVSSSATPEVALWYVVANDNGDANSSLLITHRTLSATRSFRMSPFG